MSNTLSKEDDRERFLQQKLDKKAAREATARANEPNVMIRKAGYTADFFAEAASLGLKVVGAKLVQNGEAIAITFEGVEASEAVKKLKIQPSAFIVFPAATSEPVKPTIISEKLRKAHNAVALLNPAIARFTSPKHSGDHRPWVK